MKNILYMGPYRQNDIFGEISRSYLRCIKLSNNVLSVPIYYTNNVLDNYPNHKDEIKTFSDFDCIIQHCLPGDFFVNKNYGKNIGITTIDTYDWSLNYDSISNLNTLDEIWVCSDKEQKNLIKSGITTNIKKIHPSIETNTIINNKSKLELNICDNVLKFYSIIDDINIEDFEPLILAFNLAFNFYDDVVLIIETKTKDIEQQISLIKQKIGFKHKFKQEIIVPKAPKNNNSKTHNTGDCFISCKKNNSFDTNLIEAILCGKTPLVNKNIASSEFINEEIGFLIKSHKQPVTVNKKVLPNNYDFYMASEHWYTIDIYDLISNMQKVYKMWKHDQQALANLSTNGKNLVYNFTDISVSNGICL